MDELARRDQELRDKRDEHAATQRELNAERVMHRADLERLQQRVAELERERNAHLNRVLRLVDRMPPV